jgi:outer membrane autotransporter protein
LGYSNSNLDQDRVIDLSGFTGFTRSIASGSTDAEQYSTSLAVNYRLPLETRWSLTSYGQFFYAVNQIDGFSESGSVLALRFPDQEFFTRSYSAGLRASKAISFSNGILSPFLDAGYTHESGNDGYLLRPTFASGAPTGLLVEISDPDRNFGRVDAGMSWVFLSGQQLFFSYSALVGESDTTRHAFYFGARFEF